MIASFALRYFRARKSTAAINIIAWVSVSAIAVGAAALIIVLSVFNGFTGLVKSLYADFYPTLKITPATGKFMQLDSAQLQAISQVPGVAYLSQTIEDKAVLRSQQYQTIAILKGVDDQFTKVAGVQDHIIRGTYATTDEDVALGVLGIGLESSLMLDVENSQVPIMVYMPKPDAGVTFNPAMPDQSLNSGTRV
jgi:lipoprotein-releasing system permease protein